MRDETGHQGTTFQGVRVVDVSIWRPGPYATQLLAERGAEVTKVEPPGGDPMRAYPELFDSLNRRKQLIEVDLKSEDGRRRVLELAAGADVFVEAFRPGVVSRLGVDYDAVRAVAPNIVYCSLTGFGQSGPLRDVPGHDLNYLAWGGALAPSGGEPRWPAIPVADLAGGMAAAFEIGAALVRRDRTGEGAYLDVAMADVAALWTGDVHLANRGAPGYGVFATADGFVTLGVLTEDHFWRPLCEALGLAQELVDLGFAERLERIDDVQQALRAAVATRRRDELTAELLSAGVPAAPVLNRSEMLAHAHFAARRLWG